ncbi:MAG TPA: histone deacetylase [Candidatus Sulfopaludibacter sp.]|nr:histone deacetylase [Candidatus Sulfopaludibacter sp.]
MRPTLYYGDHHPIPLPPGHKFPIAKYALLRQALSAEGICDLQPAPLADPADIELAHDPAYVRAFLSGSLDRGAMRRIGFPWSKELVRRTLSSAGGTLAAATDALANGFGGNLAGGTHHAFRSEGSGFCVFNDIAIAVRKTGRPAAVIDLDVHQGDGTAAIFEHDPSVLTVSLHGENNFPFRKQRSKIDVGFPDNTGDEPYLDRLGEVLPLVVRFRPKIVFYQSGVDSLSGDRLGRLNLTFEGLHHRDQMVFEMCRLHGFPVVVTLGGGYSDPISRTVEAHANTYRFALGLFNRNATFGLGKSS